MANRNNTFKMMKNFNCCLCGDDFLDYSGCNPDPVVNDEDAVCCHRCDKKYVIPARIKEMRRNSK